MSREDARQFLEAANRSIRLRERFRGAANPDEFAATAAQIGYKFTPEELQEVVKEHSEGVTLRRQTGVWKWLRAVRWI